MSFKNKFFSILTLAAATFAFSAAGVAQETTTVTPMTEKGEKVRKGDGLGKHGHDGRRGGHGKMGRGMGMLRGIDLTEEQRTQIRTIMEAQKPTPEAFTEIRTLATAKRDGTITAEQQERLTALKQQRKEKSLVIMLLLVIIFSA